MLCFGAAVDRWYRVQVQWTASELARMARGELIRDGGTTVQGVFIDSRAPVQDGLFVPIVAARDGHDFIPAAIEGGAAAVLIGKGHAVPDAAITVVEVDDTQAALTRLATERCASFEGPIVTISGSNGKTTTRAMVAAVLGAGFGSVLCTRGNLNNHLGVPLTVLGEPHSPDAMVVELGMSAPGENDALACITQPTAHVITSVALEHLEFMGTIEAIAAAEAEPVTRVRDGGFIVAPCDEPLLRPHLEGLAARVVAFGPDADAQVEILDVEVGATTRATYRVGGQAPVCVELQLFGAHNARNAAAALAIGNRLGIDLDAMVSALQSVEPVGDRGRTHSWGAHLLVADCYNSNPGSVEVALCSLAALADRTGPKVAVLGDMLELGPTEAQLHKEVGARAAALGIDVLLGFGPLSKHSVEGALQSGLRAIHFETIEALADELTSILDNCPPGAALIKGSRGMRLERVLERLL